MSTQGRTLGQVARYLRRHVGLTYAESVVAAMSHFAASGAVGMKKLKASRLHYEFHGGPLRGEKKR